MLPEAEGQSALCGSQNEGNVWSSLTAALWTPSSNYSLCRSRVSCHVAAGDRVRHRLAFWLLPKEPVTKMNNLYCIISDNSTQQYTHNLPPTSNCPRASLHITTDVLLNLTYFMSKDILNWLSASEDPTCHSDSRQLTAGCSAGCSTRCPEQLSEQFSNSFVNGEQRELKERSSKPVPEAAGLRLCWFSFPSPPLNKGYNQKRLSHS